MDNYKTLKSDFLPFVIFLKLFVWNFTLEIDSLHLLIHTSSRPLALNFRKDDLHCKSLLVINFNIEIINIFFASFNIICTVLYICIHTTRILNIIDWFCLEIFWNGKYNSLYVHIVCLSIYCVNFLLIWEKPSPTNSILSILQFLVVLKAHNYLSRSTTKSYNVIWVCITLCYY